MIPIRKAWWATLLLVGFAGCAAEEPPAADKPPAEVKAAGDPAPAPAKDEAKPKDDMPAPKDDAKAEKPKDDGLQLNAPATAPAPKEDAPKEEKKEAAAGKLSADELAEIEKLPAADRVLALNQMLCPVSGEHLGEMGVPLKVSAEGTSFFICCKSCNKEVQANPKDVLAKLKK